MAKRKAMASTSSMSGAKCESCPTWFCWVWLLVGLALLARDLQWFDVLGGAQWPGLVITLLGLKWLSK